MASYVLMCARDDVAGAGDWQELPDGDRVAAAAEAFRMLADPTRLQILWLLSRAESDVSALVARLGVARPAVSQHLAKLRLAGLVRVRREGRRAIYHARGGHVRRLLDEALRAADHHLTGAPDHD
jgi:DNA-binding transcriptional ArsR family regulator